MAHALIDVAKQSGAEAVKFQFYTPEGMVGKEKRTISGGPWDGLWMSTLYEMAQMPWEWGPRLKAHCHQEGLAFIASAYDTDGLNWLMQNCVPDALKVASFEATDTPFVCQMLGSGVPVIVSTGMMAPEDWSDYAVVDADAMLHCVSAYPTPANAANLVRIDRMNDSCVTPPVIGFSDHTLGHAVACAAVAKGACVVEKHIQLHPSLKTADAHFSLTPDDFKAYCSAVNEAWQACQPPVGDVEASSRQFRRAPGGKRGSYRA